MAFTLEQKRELVGSAIIFDDGCKGTVLGAMNAFATVASFTTQPHTHRFEWAWPTVKEIIEKGGKFGTR